MKVCTSSENSCTPVGDVLLQAGVISDLLACTMNAAQLLAAFVHTEVGRVADTTILRPTIAGGTEASGRFE